MDKDAFHGPLEQVNECCWRIPKSYKPGMRVDGLIFADEKLIDADPARTRRPSRWPTSPSCPASSTPAWPCPTSTGATASASAASARPTRTKAASSRRAASATTSTAACGWCASNLLLPRRQAAPAAARRGAVPRSADRRRPRGKYHFRRQGAAAADGRRAAVLWSSAAGPTPGDLDHTEAHGRLDGAEPDCVSDRRRRARQRPVRHARLRQPLPGSAGRRSRLRRRRGRASWASRRTWSA